MTSKRMTISVSTEAHEKLQSFKKIWDVPQMECLTVLLEEIDPEHPYISEIMNTYKDRRENNKAIAKALLKVSPERLKKALDAAGITEDDI